MNSEGEVHSSIGFQDAETLIHVFDSQSLGIKPNFVSRYLEDLDTYVSQAQSGTSQSRTISGAAESDPDPNPSTDPSLDPDPDP